MPLKPLLSPAWHLASFPPISRRPNQIDSTSTRLPPPPLLPSCSRHTVRTVVAPALSTPSPPERRTPLATAMSADASGYSGGGGIHGVLRIIKTVAIGGAEHVQNGCENLLAALGWREKDDVDVDPMNGKVGLMCRRWGTG